MANPRVRLSRSEKVGDEGVVGLVTESSIEAFPGKRLESFELLPNPGFPGGIKTVFASATVIDAVSLATLKAELPPAVVTSMY